MLGIGFFELVIIALVCFIAIGPKQLPLVMRKIASFYRQISSLRDELKFQLLSADDDLKDQQPKEIAQNKEALIVEREQGHG